MTCIVGIESAGRVWIGGDSAGVAGYSITARSDAKVWASGPWAFGFTSSFRMGQILRYSFVPPECQTWDVDRFMATTFIAAVRASLTKEGWMRTDSGRESGGVFLVGYRDRLYRIDSDFQIGRSLDGYDAVGCGEEIAVGSLYSTAGDPLAERRVLTAMEAAAHHSAGVCGPFVTVATEAER